MSNGTTDEGLDNGAEEIVSLNHKRNWLLKYAPTAAGVVILIALIQGFYTWAWNDSIYIEFHPGNGVYQNFNPLQRLQHGQLPGRDFNVYIGMGPLWMARAGMLFTNGTFADSLYVMKLLSSLSFLLSLIVMGLLCRLRFVTSVILAGVIVVVGFGAYPMPFGDWPEGILVRIQHCCSNLIHPDNSVRGLRAVIPIFSAMCLYPILMRNWKPTPYPHPLRTLLIALVAGVTALWSSDFGPATAVSCCIVTALALVKPARNRWRRFRNLFLLTALHGVLGICVAALLLTVVTGGYPLAWVKYMKGVSEDNFWYFEGAKLLYLSYIFTISDINYQADNLLAILAVILLVAKILRREHHTRDILILHLFLSHIGVVALYCIGGFSSFVLWGLRLVSLYFVIPVFLSAITTTYQKYSGAIPRPTDTPRQERTVWIATCIFWGIGVTLTAGYLHTINTPSPEKPWCRGHHFAIVNGPPKLEGPGIFYCPEMGGYLPAHWVMPVAFSRELKERRLAGENIRFMGTYSTIIETVSGILNPTRNDYIIHALGTQEREDYNRIFLENRPDYVATWNLSFKQYWERWLRFVNWDFYRELVRHYRRDEMLFCQIIWSPRPAPLPVSELPVECSIVRITDYACDIVVTLPDVTKRATQGTQIVEIEFRPIASWVPGARLAGGLRHRVSGDALNLDTLQPLDPLHFGIPLNRDVWRIPVEVTPERGGRIRMQLEPGELSQLKVEVLATRHMFPKAELDSATLQTLRPIPLDNQYFKSGILVNSLSAAFIVRSAEQLTGIGPGMRVRLAESGWRKIVRIESNVLWLEGPALSPVGDGFPHAVKVDTDGKQK